MAETSAPPESSPAATAVADAPPLAPGPTPLCYVVDEEASIRHFLSLVLHGSGIDTVEFSDGAAFRAAIQKSAPVLIFLNVSLDSADAIESVLALGKCGYRGAVQLMSNRGAAVLEHVKSVGVQHKLNMLAVLKKPFETEAIVKIMRELNLGMPPAVASRIELDEAIRNNWIEFWYQPKIDLRKKRLAGAEAFARARHPQHGVVLPQAFMAGAAESALTKLAEMSLSNALKAGETFSKLGINLRITVNIPAAVLAKLPVPDIVKTHRPNREKWAGLIVDVAEEEIITDIALATALNKKFEPSNVRLALDEFGRGYSALARLDALPFAEIKLGRSYVAECGSDRSNAPMCRQAIDLAHNFGSAAVGMGIERAADAVALVSMGCDFGQGFLLGQPMPEERFVSLLRQRAATHGSKLAEAR
jgi:EAL domain-containing protein (putative c-di-GMP-specific phosphodiesterase class I)